MVDWVTPFARCASTTERRGRARLSAVSVANVLNLLTILAAVTGCSAGLQGSQAARIAELESYTQELEAKVTALKEASLKDASMARTACAASSQEGDKKPSAATDPPSGTASGPSERPRVDAASTAPSSLPVVRLSPDHPFASTSDDRPAEQTEPAQDAAELVGDAEVASSDQTRPVLKLHGAQEGKVYMRALTAADKDTTL